MKTLYFKHDKEVNVHFVSDYHFGHANIIKYCNRPFLSAYDQKNFTDNGSNWNNDWGKKYRPDKDSVRMMDEEFLKNTNDLVQEQDILVDMGDWAFGYGDKYYSTCKYYRDRIICKNVYHVWGNHDEEDHEDRNGRFVKGINDLFTGCYDKVTFVINGQPIVFDHFFNAVWDKSHKNTWHLYGHSHSGIEEWADRIMPGRRAFDVGIDNIYKLFGKFRPINFDEVSDVMKKRNGFIQFTPRG